MCDLPGNDAERSVSATALRAVRCMLLLDGMSCHLHLQLATFRLFIRIALHIHLYNQLKSSLNEVL